MGVIWTGFLSRWRVYDGVLFGLCSGVNFITKKAEEVVLWASGTGRKSRACC